MLLRRALLYHSRDIQFLCLFLRAGNSLTNRKSKLNVIRPKVLLQEGMLYSLQVESMDLVDPQSKKFHCRKRKTAEVIHQQLLLKVISIETLIMGYLDYRFISIILPKHALFDLPPPP